jgi:pyruvate/2-oxoglutarate/acetoin dehydrogenase E1 component
MVNVVKDAISSDELSGTSVELIDLQTLSPLDMETVLSFSYKDKEATCLSRSSSKQLSWKYCNF